VTEDASPAPSGATFADGARLAATTFTIAPVRAGAVDPATARIAMALAPAVGVVLGSVAGGLVLGLRQLGAPPIVTGLLTIAVLAGLTRGLHLDGLADTVDGLGSYAPRERALEIMKSPEVGPFGVVALILAITIPAGCVAAITARPWWSILAVLVAACANGRLAAAFACRRGVPAAAPTGLGALVAGSVGAVELAYGLVATVAVALAAVPGRLWQGPVAVLAGLGVTVLLVRHAQRRLGGITGDVLGACVELATLVTLVGFVLA
jgi:adenosylcobinamide-GDP ribazoletransferase